MSEIKTQSQSPSRDVLVHRQGELSRRVVNKQHFDFDGWAIQVVKSTILPSNCYCDVLNQPTGTVSVSSEGSSNGAAPVLPSGSGQTRCHVCRYSSDLPIKHLPEMIFPDNILKVTYGESNFSLEFSALDALKLISVTPPEAVHVAFAEEWKAAHEGGPLPGEIKYDWTFSTEYNGTLQNHHPGADYRTEEKLNMDKLKERENILFYEELSLYEDELHDNGTSNLSVKIRVMPSGFFILQRFFLRIDNVLAKICDTRVHYEVGNKFILREFQERKQTANNLSHVPHQYFTEANLLYPYLAVTREHTEKISIVYLNATLSAPTGQEVIEALDLSGAP